MMHTDDTSTHNHTLWINLAQQHACNSTICVYASQFIK